MLSHSFPRQDVSDNGLYPFKVLWSFPNFGINITVEIFHWAGTCPNCNDVWIVLGFLMILMVVVLSFDSLFRHVLVQYFYDFLIFLRVEGFTSVCFHSSSLNLIALKFVSLIFSETIFSWSFPLCVFDSFVFIVVFIFSANASAAFWIFIGNCSLFLLVYSC